MIMSYMVSSLACLVSVSAWGPFAHTYNNTDKSAAFRTGLIAIDAFSHDWFGEKAFRPQMHSFNFTAYLLNKANTTADKDFALGIGCHLAADHVGHDGMGYLSHGLELFVDAWLHRHNNTVIKGSELGFNAGALADETIAQAMGFPPVTIENVNAQWQKFLEYENYEEKIIPYVPDALLGWTSRCKDEPNVMYNEALQGSMQVCEEWLKVNPDDSLEKIMEHGQRVIHIAQGFTPKCGETSHASISGHIKTVLEVTRWSLKKAHKEVAYEKGAQTCLNKIISGDAFKAIVETELFVPGCPNCVEEDMTWEHMYKCFKLKDIPRGELRRPYVHAELARSLAFFYFREDLP